VKYFLSLLGMVMVIEGLPYFVSPAGMKKLFEKFIHSNDQSLRIYGMISIICGLVLAWFATL